ncbi:hypothetical protein H312_02641 [Anncaliia algerae PRA339]|uniref:Uncharacterized protein n=1 Tax=Anncaliia algerae PRA339 TaxID=1288291 RepID=A0A059EY36_9MICR|nr:hypothetical protein H312_02641 [Anncaliia algerae PRA339]
MCKTRNTAIRGVGHFIGLDESLFSKRRNNIYRVVETIWIVGGVDFISMSYFLKVFVIEMKKL